MVQVRVPCHTFSCSPIMEAKEECSMSMLFLLTDRELFLIDIWNSKYDRRKYIEGQFNFHLDGEI
jgi:hypothetical protein